MAQGRGHPVSLLLAVAFLTALHAVAAKDYIVGNATMRWALPPATDPGYYDTWSSKQTFNVGDQLIFRYSIDIHDVQVVAAAVYKACAMSSAKKYLTGNDAITLSKAGDYYFLCSVIGHCAMGMKMKVTVAPESVPPEASPPPASTGAAPRVAPQSVRRFVGAAGVVAFGALLF